MALDPITAGIDLAKTFVSKFVKDKDLAAKLNAEAESQEFAGEIQLMMGQLEINKIEAGHKSLFVAGWRPAVGWICAIAVGIKFIVMPLVIFIAVLSGFPEENLPKFDFADLLALLGGMLGFGGLRTYEKTKRVARN